MSLIMAHTCHIVIIFLFRTLKCKHSEDINHGLILFFLTSHIATEIELLLIDCLLKETNVYFTLILTFQWFSWYSRGMSWKWKRSLVDFLISQHSSDILQQLSSAVISTWKFVLPCMFNVFFLILLQAELEKLDNLVSKFSIGVLLKFISSP